LPPNLNESSGRSGIDSHGTVYWPFQLLVAPSSLLSISAMSVGSAMSEVPVSMAAPVFSSSSDSSPKVMPSSSTSLRTARLGKGGSALLAAKE
jgi:hypothetical protein